ncbi:MAG: glycosyltransferase [Salinivirgaceae bacterium]|jgi:glycosyltransferase involved in cell wall biosynthesis
MMQKRTIIISAINIFEGGPLSVLQDCLSETDSLLSDSYIIIALVYSKSKVKTKNVKLIEFPKSRKSYLYRLYYEYFYFHKISKRFKPFLWLSLHDITPIVNANIRAVYCHNPGPFYKANFNDWKFSPKISLFSLFYKYLYKINIKKNNFIIVQQNWIADRFIKMFDLKKENIIVANPFSLPEISNNFKEANRSDKYCFFYPSFPRTFKNFEYICEACIKLELLGISNFEVFLTIDGSENKYSEWVVKKYSKLKTVHFVGLLTKEKIFEYYQNVDCLIFPSKLETWGLPISEFSCYDKPMLLADMDYAHETAKRSKKTSFFSLTDVNELVSKMSFLIKGDLSNLNPVEGKTSEYCELDSWGKLIIKLLK